MLSATQTGASHARDAPGDRSRSQGLLTEDGLLWTTEHRFYRTPEFDRPPWGGSAGSPDLGHFSAVSASAGPSGVVARVLSFCASSRIAADSTPAASRTRGQAGGSTLPAAYSSHGGRENQPSMDGARSSLLSPIARATRPNGSMKDVRRRPVKEQEAVW